MAAQNACGTGQDQVLGFLLAVSFLVVCLFSLLNMLLAIIMVTYDEITSEVCVPVAVAIAIAINSNSNSNSNSND